MKVVLLANVPNLGKKFDTIQVKEGFAINFLFPRKLAKIATPEAEKEAQHHKQKQTIKVEELKSRENEIKEKIKNLGSIQFARKTSEKGHLFASVTEKDIIQELKTKLNLELDSHHIEMTEHLKTVGAHTVKIKIGDSHIPLAIQVEKSA